MPRMGAHTRLRNRVFLVVAVGALVVAGGVALLLANALALRTSSESATRAGTHLLRVVDLERLVVDAETGLRGEVITGRTLFLAPLYSAQAQLPSAIGDLERAASQDGAYQQQTAALIQAARLYMSVYVRSVLAMTSHDLAGARSFAVTLEGKRQVDAIRARVAALERLLANRQAQRQHNDRMTANRSIVEAIVVLVLLTLLIGAVGSYLGHLAVARDSAREQSETTSRTLQESILPSALPQIPGCELATRFIPGGKPAVSGDFYDAVEVEPGVWALIIGDVTGKGATAAAATAMARWTLRSSLALGHNPADALRFLNDVVIRQDRAGRFITAACVKLTLGAESAHIEVACAGHPAPILVPRTGTPTSVAAEGHLLGMARTIRLDTAELPLRPGDSLVAFTDGVTDQGLGSSTSPEEALLDREPGASAEQLAARLEDLAHQPSSGRSPDDIAIIALRFLGQRAAEPPGSLVPAEQNV